MKSFFAPGCRIEARVDGAYEIFFDPQAGPGQRGADDMRIVALEPPHRLAFIWNAPRDQPLVRAQRTLVVAELQPLGEDQTHLRFTHLGWGRGQEWDRAYEYFDDGWNRAVLPPARSPLREGAHRLEPPTRASARGWNAADQPGAHGRRLERRKQRPLRRRADHR